ncbi:hypothetical protein DFH27DRAFT_632876 [Peziza echinospora]|nr:hypothetical protein DFH27DRAFT_632876 [Peziza echinospora]
MPRASTPRLAPGFTLPTRRTFILPGSEPITDARHLLDQTNEYVVHALNSSYPASIQPTNRTHHLYGYNTRSWFLSTGTWSSQSSCLAVSVFSQLEPLAFEGSRNGEGDAIPYSLPGTDTDPDPDAAQAHQTPPEVALVQPDMIPEEWRAVGRAQIALKHKEARGQISEPNQLTVPRSHPWPLGCVAPLLAGPTAAAKTVKIIANIPALTTHNVYIPNENIKTAEQYRPNFDKEEGIYTVYGPGAPTSNSTSMHRRPPPCSNKEVDGNRTLRDVVGGVVRGFCDGSKGPGKALESP